LHARGCLGLPLPPSLLSFPFIFRPAFILSRFFPGLEGGYHFTDVGQEFRVAGSFAPPMQVALFATWDPQSALPDS
jgi:hypothetical protein